MKPIEIVIRIVAAILIGTVIGVERERKNRPAGMRTHVLVCLGSCIIALIECSLKADMQGVDAGGLTYTMGRITAQVVSGIGFLGAGTIFTARKKIAGLTTAASLWNVACLGIATGFGYYLIAGLGCALVMIVLLMMQKILRVSVNKRVEIQFVHRVETIDFINKYLDEKEIKVLDVDFHVETQSNGNNLYTNIYELVLPKNLTYREIVMTLSENSNVRSVRTTNT
ncbi:MAG: MgtC/SapB family protein [Clostridia bacterium]|nr:MgtC/SapB family protein [Clostridia bacterium]